MRRLAGVGVLVTRPEHQAHGLCRLIEAEGGSTIRFPALDIHAVPELPAVRTALGPVDRFHLVIFVSANAVRFGADLLAQRRDMRIAAIGHATAAALNAASHRVSVVPQDGYDSEALLACPDLRHMPGQQVLIVRGRGGRELLGDTLKERGASVTYAEVYDRRPASPSAQLLERVESSWRQGAIDAYTATSSDLLEALVGIVTPRCRKLMDSTALVTGASRVVERVAALGLSSPVILAKGPDDAALVAALVDWHAVRRPGPRR